MKTVALVQARLSSRRLPGKVLRPAQGKPMIQYLFDSLMRCQNLDGVMLCTSDETSDDPLAHYCQEQGIACCRGPLDDVAGRFVKAVRQSGCRAFVRISGDSPLMDHRLVDRMVELFWQQGHQMLVNVHPRTFPKGQSVEVLEAEFYRRAYPKMTRAEEKEHLTKYFYNHADEIKIANHASRHEFGGLQLSVDTPEDFAMFEAVLACLEGPVWSYTYDELARRCLAYHERKVQNA